VKNPILLGLFAAFAEYLAHRYPEYRDVITAGLIGAGFGMGSSVQKSLNGNGKPSNGGNSVLPG